MHAQFTDLTLHFKVTSDYNDCAIFAGKCLVLERKIACCFYFLRKQKIKVKKQQ